MIRSTVNVRTIGIDIVIEKVNGSDDRTAPGGKGKFEWNRSARQSQREWVK